MTMTIPGMPMPMRWLAPPARFEANDAQLVIEAAGRTDWFADPAGAADPKSNAPALVGDLAGDYMFKARVRVDFRATFDAGVLMLHAGERLWAKLCFEYSPQREPMIVSVVTDGSSDDGNAFTVDGDEVWLRISRLGRAFVFHASTDGETWRFVRHFSFGEGAEPAVGFEAQSPIGAGCVATFDEISFRAGSLEDLRGGS